MSDLLPTVTADETADERADRLAETAEALVDRIRTQPAAQLFAELLVGLPRTDLYGVIGLLAAAVDPSVSPNVWWGWVRHKVAAMESRPIRWDGDEDRYMPSATPTTGTRAEDLTTARIRHLAEVQHLTDRAIGEQVGLHRDAVAARRKRARPPIPAGGSCRGARLEAA